jgi:hypothetical protein
MGNLLYVQSECRVVSAQARGEGEGVGFMAIEENRLRHQWLLAARGANQQLTNLCLFAIGRA